MAVGGDGTVFEVLNGLCGCQSATAILPGRTGNDYTGCARLPHHMYEAAVVALQGGERSVDLGRMSTGRYFLNVAGAGFDAEVAKRVKGYPKYLGGSHPMPGRHSVHHVVLCSAGDGDYD